MMKCPDTGTHRRRRAGHRRTDQAHPRAGRRHRGAHRRQRRRGAEIRVGSTAGPDHPRPQSAGRQRLEVCRILRSRADGRHVPIIMLTARTSEDDRVTGPRARRRRLRHQTVQPARAHGPGARRAAPQRGQGGPAAGGVSRRPTRGGLRGRRRSRWTAKPIRLTRREFELLRYLVQNKNRVVSRDRLLERVWGYDRSVETRSVDVHVGPAAQQARRASRQIETVIGLGYRFVD